MKNSLSAILAAGMTLLGSTAYAHISVEEVGTANATQVVKFNVGHGCEGSDTVKVTFTIPPGVTSVRPMANGVFTPAVNKDTTGAVTSVVFTKIAAAEPADTNFYQLAIRLKTPDAPFTTVYLPATQLCRSSTDVETTTEWASTVPSTTEDGPEPAPALFLLPAHQAGWNKFTVPVALTDLSVFDDAQIVWAGNAAYSSNATTKDLIGKEAGATALTTIAAGTEIWVRY
jgi:periplasmic copper chaperone A